MNKVKSKVNPKNDIWSEWYKTVGYEGNPLDKQFQQKIHDFYNSLTPELQAKWIEKTDGLGWQDEYIQAIKEFWEFKGDKPVIRDEEDVNEYLGTLTDAERGNYKDICDVFSKEKPWMHIKDTNGFLQYKNYRKTVSKFQKDNELHKKSDLATVLRSDEFAIFTFLESKPHIKNLKDFDIKGCINDFLNENPDVLEDKLIDILKTPGFQMYCFLELYPQFKDMKEDDVKKTEEFKVFIKGNIL